MERKIRRDQTKTAIHAPNVIRWAKVVADMVIGYSYVTLEITFGIFIFLSRRPEFQLFPPQAQDVVGYCFGKELVGEEQN